MRMKRMASTIATGTLALTGLGIVGASEAQAKVVNTACAYPSFYQASLGTGADSQCFVLDSRDNNKTLEVDGYNKICAANRATVHVVYKGGAWANIPSGTCGVGDIYQFTIIP